MVILVLLMKAAIHYKTIFNGPHKSNAPYRILRTSNNRNLIQTKNYRRFVCLQTERTISTVFAGTMSDTK